MGELINASHLLKSPIKATYSQKYTSWETKTIIPTRRKIILINLAIESQTSKLIPCLEMWKKNLTSTNYFHRFKLPKQRFRQSKLIQTKYCTGSLKKKKKILEKQAIFLSSTHTKTKEGKDEEEPRSTIIVIDTKTWINQGIEEG